MNPHLLLSLWRERWGKTAETNFRTSYVHGKPNTLGMHLVHARAWAVPGITCGALLVCFVLFAWMLSIRFSLGGQVAFSLFIAGFALYLQRYKGTLVTLTLFGLSLLVSARYLGWRLASTLGHEFNFEFLLAFGLCIAELHLWTLGVLAFVNRLWPLKQAIAQLPDSQSKWPTVDVYLPIHGCDYDSVLRYCMNALALEWPKGKLQVYLLDGDDRPVVQELAASMRVAYIASTDAAIAPAETINLALEQTRGELVAIFDGPTAPEKNFLKMSLGWFAKDPALGILQTSKGSTQSATIPLGTQVTLLRRAFAADAGGMEVGNTAPYPALASRLRNLGYSSGDIGFDEHLPADVCIHRTDHTSTGKLPIWKVRLVLAQAMLQFYLPVALWVFLTAPIAYLVGGVRLIHSGFDFFVAYAIPHLINGHIVKTRQREPGRLPIWTDIRDTLLAWYLLLPTFVVVLRTKLSELIARCGGKPADKASKMQLSLHHDSVEKFHWTLRSAFLVLLVLNLLGLLVGLHQLAGNEVSFEFTEPTVYFLWCLFNLMVLAAALGVAEESRHIHRHIQSLACLRAMIRAPSGHTMRCSTTNFPGAPLTLSLPAPFPLEIDSKVDVSIFMDQLEFNFPANVYDLECNLLRVTIDETALNRYQFAANAIFSRGPNWPNWLPGRNADKPLPQWLTTQLDAGVKATIALIAKIGNILQLARMLRWIQKRTNVT